MNDPTAARSTPPGHTIDADFKRARQRTRPGGGTIRYFKRFAQHRARATIRRWLARALRDPEIDEPQIRIVSGWDID